MADHRARRRASDCRHSPSSSSATSRCAAGCSRTNSMRCSARAPAKCVGSAAADRRRRHARDRQPRCEPFPSRHGHGVPEADRRGGRGRGRALRAGNGDDRRCSRRAVDRVSRATCASSGAIRRHDRHYARALARSSSSPKRASSRAGAICGATSCGPARPRHRGGLRRHAAPHASAWRSFFSFLARDGEVAANPALGVRSPKLGASCPKCSTPTKWRRCSKCRATIRSRARSRTV